MAPTPHYSLHLLAQPKSELSRRQVGAEFQELTGPRVSLDKAAAEARALEQVAAEVAAARVVAAA